MMDIVIQKSILAHKRTCTTKQSEILVEARVGLRGRYVRYNICGFWIE